MYIFFIDFSYFCGLRCNMTTETSQKVLTVCKSWWRNVSLNTWLQYVCMYSELVVVCCCVQLLNVAACFRCRWKFYYTANIRTDSLPCGLSCECLNLKIAIISKRQIGSPQYLATYYGLPDSLRGWSFHTHLAGWRCRCYRQRQLLISGTVIDIYA